MTDAPVALDELEARMGGTLTYAELRGFVAALISEVRAARALEPDEVFNAGYRLALKDVSGANGHSAYPISWRCHVRDIVEALETALPVAYPHREDET